MNLPTTPIFLKHYVIYKIVSVPVTPSFILFDNLNPTTSGKTIEIFYPSITASASIPPTPHPTHPKPLIIVVCESVPTKESGYKTLFVSKTTLAKYSKLT